MNSKRQAIIGVDNGARSGAMCALCPESGILLGHSLMPVASMGGTPESDPLALVRWMDAFDCVAVAIEEPPKHAQSAAAMRSMSLSFGICYGAMIYAKLPVCRVSVHEWQKVMLGKVPKGLTKQYALRRANELWPEEAWLPSKRSSVVHDGLVDAALIACYTLGRMLGK